MALNNSSGDKSPHILNTSSNLLGLCFIVLTSLHVLKLSEASIIDEFALGATFMFMVSCILSFLSMRGGKRAHKYEEVADWFFLTGLICVFITTLLIALGVIK